MLFWILAAAVFAADRVSKLTAAGTMSLGEHRVAIQGLLEWRLAHNRGMALGMLSGQAVAIIVLPIAAVLIGVFVMHRYQVTRFTLTAAGLIFGGFAGNLFDRVVYGYVVDMIYFPWMPWYICNVADILICAGVAMMAVSLLARPQDWRLRKERVHGDDHADGDC